MEWEFSSVNMLWILPGGGSKPATKAIVDRTLEQSNKGRNSTSFSSFNPSTFKPHSNKYERIERINFAQQ
uniref:Uncharacterized protein n=1 Tax=Cannabis sativa TaxID=3483 RepID=A0A803QHU0_CANSA